MVATHGAGVFAPRPGSGTFAKERQMTLMHSAFSCGLFKQSNVCLNYCHYNSNTAASVLYIKIKASFDINCYENIPMSLPLCMIINKASL